MTTILKGPEPARDSTQSSRGQVEGTVAEIISAVRERGSAAVREYSAAFDNWEPDSFRVSPDLVEELVSRVPEQTIEDIRFSQARVREFAEAQRRSVSDFEIETLPGIRLGQRNVPVGSVGSYVPGGRYPMVASATMSNLTASVAGVKRVVSVTPPLDGALPETTIAAMHLAGADEIYVLGGVQAVAALAIGTEEISSVDMIVGPGNAYVAEAKRQLFGEIGIDLVAGPTEILVVADDSADPETVAADLLGQAEHGLNTPAVLISTSSELASAVVVEVERQLETLPTAEVAGTAWRELGEVRVVDSLDQAVAEADDLAFEHVEIHTREPRFFLDRMSNYGTLFLGENTTVAYGDKTIGTNHILPTAGAARYTGGLWVGKFLKTVTYQECSREASVRIGEVCARQCRVENFEGHALSCDVRLRRFA